MIQIELTKGIDNEFTLTFTNEDESPIDLTEFDDIFLDISASPIVTTERLKLSIDNGISIFNENILAVNILKAQTKDLIQKKYYGDVIYLNDNIYSKLTQLEFNITFSSTNIND